MNEETHVKSGMIRKYYRIFIRKKEFVGSTE